jgi:CHAD domain-containing protein
MQNAQNPAPKPQPDILARDSMAEAGRKVLNFHFQRMLQKEVGTRLGENIKALHAMRVATRRMRAAFRVFKPYYKKDAIKQHRQGLKSTGRILGAVRDWDVLLKKTRDYYEALQPTENIGLEFLVDFWSHERELAQKQLLTFLDGQRFHDFKLAFSEFVHIPSDELEAVDPQNWLVYKDAPPLIILRYEQVLAHEGSLQNPTVAQLHALRIDFKRLRYTVEFFRSTLGEGADFCIAEIKLLQDHLGDLNDADVALQRIQKSLAEQESSEIVMAAVEEFYQVKEAEMHQLVDTFPQAWARFRQPVFRQHLDTALKELRHPI